MSRMRVAVVGLGWWGRQLIDRIADSDVVEVTDVVEPMLDAASGYAATRGLELHEHIEGVLAIPEIDGVLIATPHRLHTNQALAAAEAEKHVFCEKPLALRASDARRMVEACTDRGLALGVGHERRYEGAMEAIADMAGSGELGTLLHVDCNWSHDLFAGADGASWRRDPEQAPLGTLTALGIHITDYLQSIGGPVAEVRAIAQRRSDDFDAEDVVTVQFRFESGLTGTMTNLATTPFYSRISVFGDRAWVEARESSNVDVPEPALLVWQGPDHELRTRTYAATNTIRANVEAWARSAVGDGDYRFSHRELVHNIEILEAIVKSAAGGSAETLS